MHTFFYYLCNTILSSSLADNNLFFSEELNLKILGQRRRSVTQQYKIDELVSHGYPIQVNLFVTINDNTYHT